MKIFPTNKLYKSGLLSLITVGFLGFSSLGNKDGAIAQTIPLKNQAQTQVTSIPLPDGLNYRKTQVSIPQLDVQNNLKFLRFVVQILQVNLTQSASQSRNQTSLQMRPIWQNSDRLTGNASLKNIAETQGAIAAINGGFFHVSRQMPLGAIKSDNIWLSGSVLGRGAIAWNDRGEISIDRLNYTEEIILANRTSIPLSNLNSGYVQKGIARYSINWGSSYTPLTDNEVIITVQQTTQGDRVLSLSPSGIIKVDNSFPIPKDGYLLVARQAERELTQLIPNSQITLQSQTSPNSFSAYSHLLAAGPLLLKNKKIVLDAKLEGFRPAFITEKATRSAIATTSQPGEILMVTIQATPEGQLPNLHQTAEILQKLGAVDGLNLDGGSPSSLYLNGDTFNSRPIHNGIGIFIKSN
jgi:hypothetical protein